MDSVVYCAGSYTDSKGIEMIRRNVAKWISERDGYDADFNNIYLINGATDGIRVCSLHVLRSCVLLSQTWAIVTAVIKFVRVLLLLCRKLV